MFVVPRILGYGFLGIQIRKMIWGFPSRSLGFEGFLQDCAIWNRKSESLETRCVDKGVS